VRTIHTDEIVNHIREMCIESNLCLSSDVEQGIILAERDEDSALGKKVLGQLVANMGIAREDRVPICQDTGMAVVFLDIGQDVRIEGMYIEDAVNEGVRRGYEEGYLRMSVVSDPLLRVNTNDNTPAIVHYQMARGEVMEITVAPKGFGSENMSRVYMLRPSDGEEGVINAILETVRLAGANACPPMVVGIGIGGTFEKCALLAKKALLRDMGERSRHGNVKELEERVLGLVNGLDIGAGGFGGKTTALAVNIETYATHIAGLPVAVNVCCHVNRHVTRRL